MYVRDGEITSPTIQVVCAMIDCCPNGSSRILFETIFEVSKTLG